MIPYPIEILKKYKHTLEANVKGVEGMLVDDNLAGTYRKRIRELRRAIEYLEAKETRRQMKLSRD